MATLALAAVGAAAGSAILPAGVTLFGATLTGAAIGAQAGAFAGSYVDQILFGSLNGSQTVRGPRLSDLHVTASTEGSPLPRVYGRARLGGQIIWANEIEEEVVTSTASGSGKGIGASGPKTQTYNYYASFAVALAEGEITGLGRIWADGAEIDLSQTIYRLHHGSETQEPDELIAAIEGPDSTPAFRGVAYVVFDRLPLADFGNRVPQLSFEVFRDVERFGEKVRGVVLIPGSGEFVYATTTVSTGRFGVSQPINVHTRQGGSDWTVSLDQMQRQLPKVENVSLVVSWFGTDLRANHCELRPGVDSAAKATFPLQWRVAGLSRNEAPVVSAVDGRAAYGGTPSDDTVVAAIKDLRARGYGVTLTPFILMDIPADNALNDPYSGSASQPAFPWRGRITCDPAPGVSGSVDGEAAAAAQVSDFVGTAAVRDFSIAGETVRYSGPVEWSFRRMVLHYAHLAKAAGGVDTFVIGTELRGLTSIRSGPGEYPFVSALVQLAGDVRTVLGPEAKLTYAADWTEYFGHQPADGSGDVYFHLDPLWSSADIDAVGIDLYWPLADWRDGVQHLDALSGAPSIYDRQYLAGNAAAGEGFDWYYASDADRSSQARTIIEDGGYAKPWVFRYKDLRSWWSEQHFNRPGGIEAPTPTSWQPQSKPIWFMEIGCPAIDRGANQPNVFVDPKSSESAMPYFSRGTRDDLMQRRYVEALTGAFDPESDLYRLNANPFSPAYGGRMVSLERMYVYAWDARPFPAFPNDLETWGDGESWRLGHWLNGRSASVSLSALVRRLGVDFGADDIEATRLEGIVPGFVVDRVMSLRDAVQPLSLAYFFDAVESGAKVVMQHRAGGSELTVLDEQDLVERDANDPLFTLVRSQETELPASAKITYIGAVDDYRQQVAESRRLIGGSTRVSQAEVPLVLEAEHAGAIADTWLHEVWAGRERAQFALPPSQLALEPGDRVALRTNGALVSLRVTGISDEAVRDIEARRVDASIYDPTAAVPRPAGEVVGSSEGPPLVHLLDLPLLRGDEPPEQGYVAALRRPWPGSLALYRSPGSAGYTLSNLIGRAAVIGALLADVGPGPEGRLDNATRLSVRLLDGQLISVTHLQLLSGSNAAAIQASDGGWEVLQFEAAELVAPLTYELSGLLRGQAGTDAAMQAGALAGATFVLIDASLTPVPLTIDEVSLAYNWRAGPANRPVGDANYISLQHTFAALGLRPLSPVHVRSMRSASGSGDIELSWVRRTRSGGDSWELAEVPLGETTEAYEVDILDGETVKRTYAANAPRLVYPLADQVADFGAAQPSYTVRVHQVSSLVGRGTGRTAVI